MHDNWIICWSLIQSLAMGRSFQHQLALHKATNDTHSAIAEGKHLCGMLRNCIKAPGGYLAPLFRNLELTHKDTYEFLALVHPRSIVLLRPAEVGTVCKEAPEFHMGPLKLVLDCKEGCHASITLNCSLVVQIKAVQELLMQWAGVPVHVILRDVL